MHVETTAEGPSTSPCPPAPCRVTGSAQAWPLHDTATTRTHEALQLASTPPHALMARAGLAAARLLRAVQPHARRVAVLAGPGNNGGDGLVAAWHLRQQGLDVQVLHLADPARLPPDAAQAFEQARAASLRFATGVDELADADVVVDGLLGLGSSRAPDGAVGAAVRWVQTWSTGTGRPVLALDLPTGLHADTGARLGTDAIQARWTLSLLTLKPGLFTGDGRDLAGEVWLDTLGAAPAPAPAAWLGPARAAPAPGLAVRHHAQHKGSFGDVLVVGGAAGMHGALLLAARAALTAGAGRVYASPLSAPAAALGPELMTRDNAWADDSGWLLRCTVACGCGGGLAVAQALPVLLRQAPRLVLDADALNRVAEDAALQQALAARAGTGRGTVLTPHPLEAARLLQTDVAHVQRDRFAAARTLADRWGTVVVLKGSGTVVAAPGETPWVNATGNARLATPGSGDVLAGWLAGWWAQAESAGSSHQAAALHAARLAVWLHGRAVEGSAATAGPVRALDLIDAMATCQGRP